MKEALMPYGKTAVLMAALALSAPAAAFPADKLDKEGKKWLEDVRPVLLPDEEKTFRALKDKGDREEFQKIFWARRDPDLETAANEFRTEYEATKADVDTRFRVTGRPGSATDCGRVYILLGAPDEVKREPGAGGGSRTPETWIYRDRANMKFKDGQALILFDGECQLPQGARLAEQMARVAENKIANPNLDYRTGSDGHLVKLADQLPKPSAGSALLKAPRQDFTATAQSKMFLRSPGGGGSYLAGLIRGDATGLTVHEASGKKTVKVLVATQAVDEAGKATPVVEREVMAEVAPDNSFLASYGLASRPGSYTVNVALVDPAGQKGTVVSAPLRMPDFGTDELAVSDVLVLEDVQEGVTIPPSDPYWAFALGNTRLLPHFDNAFRPAESVMLLGVVYNAKTEDPPVVVDGAAAPTEPPAGKASVTVGFTISKDGKLIAQAPDQSYDTPSATPGVGPVPLAKYTPGKYVVKMKVRDNLGKKDVTKEAEFEIR
jgi:GWxTD domain-containing protein